MIDETLDAATPYPGSLVVRKLFPGASLIALPGGTSHANSLFGDACEDNQIAAYLAHGTLPDRKPGNRADATCKPLPRAGPDRRSRPGAGQVGDERDDHPGEPATADQPPVGGSRDLGLVAGHLATSPG